MVFFGNPRACNQHYRDAQTRQDRVGPRAQTVASTPGADSHEPRSSLQHLKQSLGSPEMRGRADLVAGQSSDASPTDSERICSIHQQTESQLPNQTRRLHENARDATYVSILVLISLFTVAANSGHTGLDRFSGGGSDWRRLDDNGLLKKTLRGEQKSNGKKNIYNKTKRNNA